MYKATVFHGKKNHVPEATTFLHFVNIYFFTFHFCGEKKVKRRWHRMEKKAKIGGPIWYYARNQPRGDKGSSHPNQSCQIIAVHKGRA
jgi:hypothetical protein